MTSLSSSIGRSSPRWWRKVQLVSRRANLFLVLEIAAAVALSVMLILSYAAISANSQSQKLLPSTHAAMLLVGTLIPAMALLVLAGRRLALRRTSDTTARLHVRLVFFFSLVAAIPTLLVAVFAAFLFQSGVEFWFSDNSRGILENANQLARGYYQDNQRDVGNETLTMASDVRKLLADNAIVSANFGDNYSYQVIARKLNESAILQKDAQGELQTAAIVDPEDDISRPRVSPADIARLDAGEGVIVNASAERIEAITTIDRAAGIYLYNARNSDALALNQWQRARSVVAAYDVLTKRARTLQLRFNLLLFGMSLALVGLAVWFALRFADRQVQPLTDLVMAARRVGAGNYTLRVEGRTGADEIGLLNRAFNRMTAQIERQTTALLGANHQLDERRAFIEAVLESITAGIVSVDRAGDVLLMNSSAQALLLDRVGPAPVGLPMEDIAPQLAQLLSAGLSSGLVQYNRRGELLTLAVKLAPATDGHVITFEDITRQLLDQRQAAWSDVARRIAHEIKNPLTPIQLATERLNRRYRKQITLDGELFDELTATIIRQVGDLRKMVDEFSSFARLPKPIFRQEDALDLIRQAIFLQEVARPDLDFRLAAPDDREISIACDRHQFGQAMTNVLKNAVEAVETQARTANTDYRGRIAVAVVADEDGVNIAIEDNGIGLPENRERIVEPYVTTREKGTGLGLAIVKKIVEEHGGNMNFDAVAGGGTCVSLRFARDPLHKATSEAAE